MIIRHCLFIAALVIFSLNPVFSQKHEVGLQLGTANFLGDLGGANAVGSPFVKDLELKLFRPAGGVFYRYNITRRFSITAALNIGELRGDDALLQASPGDPHWPRRLRNLHFRSMVYDLSVKGEWNIFPFEIGDMRRRFTPYLTAGIGVFRFNPKAKLNDQWVALQPLGTEGQGLPEYPDRKKYSRIQPNVQVGAGVKYNLNTRWALGFEITHRFTNTDYIDDVSTTYVSPTVFTANYDAQTAATAIALANRSGEITNDKDALIGSAPGQQRGDPKDKDQYFFALVSLSYRLGRSEFDCPK